MHRDVLAKPSTLSATRLVVFLPTRSPFSASKSAEKLVSYSWVPRCSGRPSTTHSGPAAIHGWVAPSKPPCRLRGSSGAGSRQRRRCWLCWTFHPRSAMPTGFTCECTGNSPVLPTCRTRILCTVSPQVPMSWMLCTKFLSTTTSQTFSLGRRSCSWPKSRRNSSVPALSTHSSAPPWKPKLFQAPTTPCSTTTKPQQSQR
mmetsp:Transcript_24732/g.52703  ORF Transcript_24732/g.52703 Transcript_24732/m.52703 type:complete len:201 (-) Transcript_24732:548-1150(-)